jgi:hypothetical protein
VFFPATVLLVEGQRPVSEPDSSVVPLRLPFSSHPFQPATIKPAPVSLRPFGLAGLGSGLLLYIRLRRHEILMRAPDSVIQPCATEIECLPAFTWRAEACPS